MNTRLIPVKSPGESGSTGYKPVGTIRKKSLKEKPVLIQIRKEVPGADEKRLYTSMPAESLNSLK